MFFGMFSGYLQTSSDQPVLDLLDFRPLRWRQRLVGLRRRPRPSWPRGRRTPGERQSGSDGRGLRRSGHGTHQWRGGNEEVGWWTPG